MVMDIVFIPGIGAAPYDSAEPTRQIKKAQMPTVKSIHLAPVKSLALLSVDRVNVTTPEAWKTTGGL